MSGAGRDRVDAALLGSGPGVGGSAFMVEDERFSVVLVWNAPASVFCETGFIMDAEGLIQVLG
jgi:hypothetical protein